MSYTIKVDIRERTLIQLLKAKLNLEKLNLKLIIESLPLADVILCDHNDNEILYIERKSINDLASSIQDGRYAEQSLRLNSIPIHNHNIIYLIEGNVNELNTRYGRINHKAIYSSFITLSILKGFSVMRSFDIEETSEIITRFADKLMREDKKGINVFYQNQISQKDNENDMQHDSSLNLQNEIIIKQQQKHSSSSNYFSQQTYSQTVKKVKKDNVTPENIGEIILSQIPGVSNTTAKAIFSKYDTLCNLIHALEENSNALQNLSYTTQKGQTRRINQKAASNVVNYLLYKRENKVIEINC